MQKIKDWFDKIECVKRMVYNVGKGLVVIFFMYTS